MITFFNELSWHDASIKSILIDRKTPGIPDKIKLIVIWPEDVNESCIEFHDCYAFKTNINFGVIVDETVLSAEFLDDSQDISYIRSSWK